MRKLQKEIAHDSMYLSDDPDGSGARDVAKKEKRVVDLQVLILRDALEQISVLTTTESYTSAYDMKAQARTNIGGIFAKLHDIAKGAIAVL